MPLKTLIFSLFLILLSCAIVQPDSLYEVYSSVSGILDTQFVQEGDSISKGKPLFQIFNKTPELNKENAKLSLQKAREDYNGSAAILSGLQSEIRTASLKLKNDSVNYMRQKRLWEQKIGSQSQYDNIKLKYESSANTVQVLRNNYARTKSELQNRVEQANNTYIKMWVSLSHHSSLWQTSEAQMFSL